MAKVGAAYTGVFIQEFGFPSTWLGEQGQMFAVIDVFKEWSLASNKKYVLGLNYFALHDFAQAYGPAIAPCSATTSCAASIANAQLPFNPTTLTCAAGSCVPSHTGTCATDADCGAPGTNLYCCNESRCPVGNAAYHRCVGASSCDMVLTAYSACTNDSQCGAGRYCGTTNHCLLAADRDFLCNLGLLRGDGTAKLGWTAFVNQSQAVNPAPY